MKAFFRSLGTTLPIYVTRQDASGGSATFSANAWIVLVAALIVQVNILLWGAYGIIQAVEKLF